MSANHFGYMLFNTLRAENAYPLQFFRKTQTAQIYIHYLIQKLSLIDSRFLDCFCLLCTRQISSFSQTSNGELSKFPLPADSFMHIKVNLCRTWNSADCIQNDIYSNLHRIFALTWLWFFFSIPSKTVDEFCFSSGTPFIRMHSFAVFMLVGIGLERSWAVIAGVQIDSRVYRHMFLQRMRDNFILKNDFAIHTFLTNGHKVPFIDSPSSLLLSWILCRKYYICVAWNCDDRQCDVSMCWFWGNVCGNRDIHARFHRVRAFDWHAFASDIYI